ncbi:MAG: DUF3617 domain-containing protein [Gammaproteobacteria bacterium]
MKLHTVGIALLLAAAPWAAQAAKAPDLSHVINPGEWAYTVDANMQIGQMAIPAKKLSNKKCITQKDLDKSKSWFAKSNKQCTLKKISYAGKVLTFTQKCQVSGGDMTLKGNMTIDSRTAYHGVIDTTGSVGGQNVTGQTTIKAHRTGGCTAATGGK